MHHSIQETFIDYIFHSFFFVRIREHRDENFPREILKNRRWRLYLIINIDEIIFILNVGYALATYNLL